MTRLGRNRSRQGDPFRGFSLNEPCWRDGREAVVTTPFFFELATRKAAVTPKDASFTTVGELVIFAEKLPFMQVCVEDENDGAAIAAPVATKVNAPMRKWAVAGDLVLKRAANECPANRRGAMYVKLRPSALPPRHADVAKPKRNAA